MILSSIIKEYQTVLRQADWNYQYCDDPRAYREGADSVSAARSMKNRLIENHPDDADTIDEMWNEARG